MRSKKGWMKKKKGWMRQRMKEREYVSDQNKVGTKTVMFLLIFFLQKLNMLFFFGL